MANQQLVDYINAQRAKGVSRDAINAALLGAGWSAADVTGAMDQVFGAAVAAPATPSMGAAASSSGIGSYAAPKTVQPFGSAAPSGPVSFQPKTTAPVSSPFGSSLPTSFTAPSTASASAASFESDAPTEHHLSKPLIAAVIVVVLLLIGGLAYWYFGSSATAPSAPSGQLDQTAFDALTQNNNELKTQVAQLTTKSANAENQLSLFASTTTREVPFTVRGTVQQSPAKVFTVTTDHNIVITVANSKDAKVIAALTPLVGTTAEVQGTHPPVSAQLTLTAVNGAPLTVPVAATTTSATTATSTTTVTVITTSTATTSTP